MSCKSLYDDRFMSDCLRSANLSREQERVWHDVVSPDLNRVIQELKTNQKWRLVKSQIRNSELRNSITFKRAYKHRDSAPKQQFCTLQINYFQRSLGQTACGQTVKRF